jgi:hypothetical protein
MATDTELFTEILKRVDGRLDVLIRENAEIKAELKSDITGLTSEITKVRTELKSDVGEIKSEIAKVRTELKSDIGEIKSDFKADIADLKIQMRSQDTKIWGFIAALFATAFGFIAKLTFNP